MEKFDIRLDPRRCALVNIDMQNDFVSPGGFNSRQGKNCGPMQSIIPTIQFLLQELPADLKRIHIATIREPDGSDNHWRRHNIIPKKVRINLENRSADINMLRGTWGAEIVDALKPGPADSIFYKRRYSAFYGTDLEMCLRCWDIDTLIFTGVVTEICVETTVRSAFVRDFDVIVVEDAVASFNETSYRSSLDLMAEAFGMVLSASEVITLFDI